MAEQISRHVSPDGLLTFLVVTDKTGDVALGFEGYPWHTHADILAALSEVGTTPEVAIEQFMAALLGNRSAIVVTTVAGRIKDVWVSDDPSEEDLPKSSDEVVELRFWDGTPWCVMRGHMDLEKRLPFDPCVVGAVSRRLSGALFSALPQLQPYALMVKSGEEDGLSLVLEVPSPTMDPDRQLVIWVDEIGTPSIGFGPSHTHESQGDDGIKTIIEWAEAVFGDKILIIEDVGGDYPGHTSWIDLREPDALEEELTSRNSPGTALLRSWSGSADRYVSTENL